MRRTRKIRIRKETEKKRWNKEKIWKKEGKKNKKNRKE